MGQEERRVVIPCPGDECANRRNLLAAAIGIDIEGEIDGARSRRTAGETGRRWMDAPGKVT